MYDDVDLPMWVNSLTPRLILNRLIRNLYEYRTRVIATIVRNAG